MRFILTILLAVIFTSCESQTYILGRGNRFFGKQVVFEGNSITFGYGVPEGLRWSTLFSQSVNAIEVNVSESGKMLVNHGCAQPLFDIDNIPEYSGQAALFFSLGINDVGWNNGTTSSAEFKDSLRSAMQQINAKGWRYSKIILNTNYWAFSYDAFIGTCSVSVAADEARAEDFADAIIEIGVELGIQVIDLYNHFKDAVLDESYFLGDELHPNSQYHLLISNYILSEVL